MTSTRVVGGAMVLGALWLAVALGPAAALAQEESGSPLGDTAAPSTEAPAAIPGPAPASSEPALLRAWSEPAASLEKRAARTRLAALESGTWSFDPAARAVLAGAAGGDPLERAEAAVALAPQLPLAHMELAKAQWLHADAPMAALRAALKAIRAITSHPEASLWFAGSGLLALAVGTSLGALWMLALVVLRDAPHVAHDLGHLVPGKAPVFARFALLFATLLVPIAAGEGVFGIALVLLLVGVAYGSAGQRAVLALTALALFAAMYPMARTAAAALEAFPDDSVARAAYSLSQGLASPADLRRLEAAPEDPLALRALAMDARRRGHLGRADALYQEILAKEPGDIATLNNAGNVRLALGHMENALDLYGRALDLEQSPVVLFNLSQAYGRAFRVDDLNRTLAAAQNVDGELVAELTALQREQSESFVVDLPFGVSLLWQRALAGRAGEALSASLRAPWAPGRLGGSEHGAALALGASFAIGLGLGVWHQRSRGCGRCGTRLCVRCETDWAGALCQSCDLLFNHPERTDRALRLARLEALRRRDRLVGRASTLAALCVPGAAGLLASRPLRAFAAALGVAVAGAFLWWRRGVVPDPLVAGAAAPALFSVVAGLALLVYAASLLSSLAARRGGES